MQEFKDFFKDPKVKFTLVFAGIFLATFVLLYTFGLVPEELRNGTSALDDLQMQTLQNVSNLSDPSSDQNAGPTRLADGEEPVHLTIPNTQVDILVQNPTTKDNTLLDDYLTKGAIRYPDSALLGEGNTLIFGHSSNWAIVHNEAYKALNGIETLKRGDTIYVDSATSRYVYTVETEATVNADQEFVDFSTTTPMLTLSTCDLFGDTTQARFVVTAIFDEKTVLPQS